MGCNYLCLFRCVQAFLVLWKSPQERQTITEDFFTENFSFNCLSLENNAGSIAVVKEESC